MQVTAPLRLAMYSPLAFLIAIQCLAVPGWAQLPAAAPGAPAAFTPPPQRERESYPSMEEVTKDMKRVDGLLTLFYNDPPERSRDPERLLALVSMRAMNQDLLLATSISQGGSYTGWMWDDFLIRFEVRGRQVAVVLPEVRYNKGSNELSEVIQKTYNSRILTTAPILAMSGSEPLIDLGPLLKSNLAELPAGGGVRSDLSRWTKKKVFANNILIEVELAVGGYGAGMNLMGVAYALRRLPELGSYQSRIADDRVGYFLTARRDWTKKHDSRDLFDRYINRWNLKKKDPSLELSPPERPITFIIEKTVPVQWRRWVRQGIEVWNKAFEKIGYTDAIQVLQQTNDNDLKDIDPEDANYNFFRWIVSGQPFAMGPSRTDPRTGEILDADIIFDDSMVRYWIQDFDLFSPRAMAEMKGPGFRTFLEHNKDRHIPFLDVLSQTGTVEEVPAESPRKAAEEMFRSRGQDFCDYSIGLQHQIALGYYTMAVGARSHKIPERLIGESIRETVTHEIGHTLGLRHNFKGSSWLSLDEVKRRRTTEEPMSGSVMDYNPILFFAPDNPETSGHFTTPTIGPYDYWAIEYGYKTGDDSMLSQIASRCAEPGLAYATDEDTMWVYSPDPLVARFDMSSDPFQWSMDRVKLVDKLMSQVAEVATPQGESRYYLTQAFETLFMEKGTCVNQISRWIGGQFFYRDHRGDPGGRTPFVLVPAQKQREALGMLKDTLFKDEFFHISADMLNQLAPPRWMHWGSRTSTRLDYPIHDRIRMLQWYTLVDLMAPPVLQRIYDAELKSTEADKFTVNELLTTLRDQVWAVAGQAPTEQCTEAKPFLSSTTRGLQREHLELLMEGILSSPDGSVSPDLHALLCGCGRDLSARIATVLKDPSKLDLPSRAHLMECHSRLDRALEAQFQRRF